MKPRWTQEEFDNYMEMARGNIPQDKNIRKNRLSQFDDLPVPKSKLKLPEWHDTGVGFCVYCGSESDEDHCSIECLCKLASLVADRSNSIRRYVHKYYGFECQKCHVTFSCTTPINMTLVKYDGIVHHVKPLFLGGDDSFENLTLLCNKCHTEIHKILLKELKNEK